MILLIDNYDSFVYNLARYFEELGRPTEVRRNREVNPARIREMSLEALVISPGPCDPSRAGCSVGAVRELSGELPILGICLGHQAIACALGGRVIRAPEPVHGMASPITHDGQGIFRGIPNPFTAARYHSLIVDPESLPEDLEITATTPDRAGSGLIMAIQHRRHPTIGLQFHPESVLTEPGHRILENFIEMTRDFHASSREMEGKPAPAFP